MLKSTMAATLSARPHLEAPVAGRHSRSGPYHRGSAGYLLDLCQKVKRTPQRFAQALSGRYLSLLFEKPSLRTRLTFELAIKQLGGDSVTVTGPIGEREPLKDVARNLDRWTHGIVARVFSQRTIEELAQVVARAGDQRAERPVSSLPGAGRCATLKEHFGRLRGLKLAFVGDGNNVAHSLMLTAPRLGVNFAIATPRGLRAERRHRRAGRETGQPVRARPS